MRTRPRTTRRGAIAALVAAGLTALLVMVAFAVDFSYVAQAQAELQAYADASALAAGQSLGSSYVSINTTGNSIATCKTLASDAAKRCANSNTVSGTTYALADNEITYGYTTSAGYPAGYSSVTTNYPNTVTVTKTVSFPLFFGNVVGVSTQSITATATVLLQAANSNSINLDSGNPGGHVVPFVYNYYWWQQYLANGTDPKNKGNGTHTLNGSTYNILSISPDKISDSNPSVRGWMSLDFSSTSQGKSIQNWIDNGVSALGHPVDAEQQRHPDLHPPAAEHRRPVQLVALQRQQERPGAEVPRERHADLAAAGHQDPGANGTGDPLGSSVGGNGFNVVGFVPVIIVQANVGDLRIIPSPYWPSGTKFDNLGTGSGTPLDTTSQQQTIGSQVQYVYPRLVN